MFVLKVAATSLLLSVCQQLTVNGPNYQTVIVPEDSDAVLPCSLLTNKNINFGLFDWKKPAQKDEGVKEVFFYDAGVHYNNGRSGQSEQFKGRVSHFPDELKHGNASITIRNTRVADSGNYTCDFPRLQPRQIFHTELVVEPALKDRSRENKAAAPNPHLTIVDVRASGVLLQCHVPLVHPMPNLEWRDSAGNVLDAEETPVSQREGFYNVTLQTTVTMPDCFSCVVIQEDIGHVTHSEITVSENLFRDTGSGVSIGLFIGGVVAALILGVVIVLAVLALLVSKKRFNKGSHQKRNYEKPQTVNVFCKHPLDMHDCDSGLEDSPPFNDHLFPGECVKVPEWKE